MCRDGNVPGHDGVAASTGESCDMPVVQDLQLGHRHRRPHHLRRPLRGLSVGGRDRGRQQMPVRMVTAGREGPGAADPIAPVVRHRRGAGDQRAADPGVGTAGAGEEVVLCLVCEERRDVRDTRLTQRHPGRGPALEGDLGEGVDLRAQRRLVTAVAPGDVHPVDAGAGQRGDDLVGHPPFTLGAQRVPPDQRPQFPYAFDNPGIGHADHRGAGRFPCQRIGIRTVEALRRDSGGSSATVSSAHVYAPFPGAGAESLNQLIRPSVPDR